MDAAWEQVGDIIEANRKLRQAQLAKEVSAIWYQRHLKPLHQANAERGFVMMAPVQRRVVAGGLTVHHAVAGSIVPRAALSPPLRRIVRPRDHVAAKLGFARPAGPGTLITRINDGEVSASPPKVTPDDLPSVDEVAGELRPRIVPDRLLDWLRDRPWAKYVILAIAIVLAVLLLLIVPGPGLVIGPIVVLAGAALFVRSSTWSARRGRPTRCCRTASRRR